MLHRVEYPKAIFLTGLIVSKAVAFIVLPIYYPNNERHAGRVPASSILLDARLRGNDDAEKR